MEYLCTEKKKIAYCTVNLRVEVGLEGFSRNQNLKKEQSFRTWRWKEALRLERTQHLQSPKT